MKIIYIAGPMTGLPDYNRPAFNSLADKLKSQGHVVLNPATLPDGLSQPQYMDICISMLKCADEVLILPGYERSLGAMAEIHLAQKLGITCCFQPVQTEEHYHPCSEAEAKAMGDRCPYKEPYAIRLHNLSKSAGILAEEIERNGSDNHDYIRHHTLLKKIITYLR